MSFPRTVKAVVFDMDGLLVDTETVVYRAMERASAAIGGQMPFGVFQRMVGLQDADSDLIVIDHFGPGFDLQAWSKSVSEHAHEEMEAGVALKAGVEEILEYLAAANIPCAIATSSGSRAVERSLGRRGLTAHFGAIITRELQSRGKPHPEPFLQAAAALGIAPADCLALEDSHNGVRAASSAGMMTIMVPDMLDPTEEMHRLTVRIAQDLHEVRELLEAQASAIL